MSPIIISFRGSTGTKGLPTRRSNSISTRTARRQKPRNETSAEILKLTLLIDDADGSELPTTSSKHRSVDVQWTMLQ